MRTFCHPHLPDYRLLHVSAATPDDIIRQTELKSSRLRVPVPELFGSVVTAKPMRSLGPT